MENVFITTSDKQTRELGHTFAKEIASGAVIALHGDLGSGKTTFTQGLAEALGVTRNVTSPTFLIQKSYELAGTQSLYHLDLYRLQNEKEAESIGIHDLLSTPKNIVIIEWPEKISSLLPKNIYHLFFTYISENERKIEIKKP